MFKQSQRLAKDKDVKMVLSRGRNFFSPYFTIKVLRSPQPGQKRFTVIVSTKVSKLAVKRNRIKRLVRETLKTLAPQLPSADYAVIAKPQVMGLESPMLRRELSQMFLKLKR